MGQSGVEEVSNNPNEPGFIKFKSPEYGIRALGIDLTTKYNRGLNTIEKIVSTYAPINENDTTAYIEFVEQYTKIPRNQKLTLNRDTLRALIKAKVILESTRPGNRTFPYTEEILNKGLDMVALNNIHKGRNTKHGSTISNTN